MTRVLIVDDSSADRMLVEGLLTQNPRFQTITAASGDEALSIIESISPDLVVADVLMPGLDGLELVRRLAAKDPPLPVVLTSARGTEEMVLRALESGADGYVPKARLAEGLPRVCESVLEAAEAESRDRRLMRTMVSQSCTFELGPDATLFRPLIRYVQRQLEYVGFGDERARVRSALALEEAINNAHEHGNLELDSELREHDFEEYSRLLAERAQQAPYRDRRIRLESHLRADEIRLVVQDDGDGFEPGDLPDPREPENIERASGRGVLLMKTFMDEVRFTPKGNRVEMRRRASRSAPAHREEGSP